MDGDKVDKVAWFPAVSSRRGLVRSEIDGVQHITEEIVPLRGKKAEGAILKPFQSHLFAKTFQFRSPRFNATPPAM
jgi:hypothetical protein